jgi:DNA-binding XRE family transcriptional regulator
MPGVGSTRGDVNAILSALIREGVITSFKTNFDTLSGALAPHIMVTADVVTLSGKPGYDPKRVAQIRNTVLRKLNPIGPGVIVSVRGTVPEAQTIPGDVTGEQCRAARHLLGWSLADHSHVAGVGLQSIGAFERGTVAPRPETLKAIIGALEGAGVEFTDADVRLRADAMKRKPS